MINNGSFGFGIPILMCPNLRVIELVFEILEGIVLLFPIRHIKVILLVAPIPTFIVLTHPTQLIYTIEAISVFLLVLRVLTHPHIPPHRVRPIGFQKVRVSCIPGLELVGAGCGVVLEVSFGVVEGTA